MTSVLENIGLVFLRLFETNEMTPELAERIANHIAGFTLAALANNKYHSNQHSQT